MPLFTSELLYEIKGIISNLEKDLPSTFDSTFSRLVNWKGVSDIPIHRWFRYREAFSPLLINKLGLGKRILDPFCGSGSIMCGAAQTGRQSIGIDINPLAVFVSQVKLNPLSYKQIQKINYFKNNFRDMMVPDKWSLPLLSIASKVFEPEILETILRLRSTIAAYSFDDADVGNLLKLAWISILEDVGSYFKEGNGIKYRNKKRLKTGYIQRNEGDWQLERFGMDQREFVYTTFTNQLALMIADMTAWQTGAWQHQRVVEGSALDITNLLGSQTFDSIIFSPPYANRFDYFESLKVELWFGGFVNSYEQLSELRKRSLRSHLGADLRLPAIQIEPLEALLGLMDQDSSSWRMGVPTALRGYFDDMYHTLIQCKLALGQGACSIVVGNSAFAGVIIPTDVLIAHLGLAAGFSSAKIIEVRHLTVAPQQRLLLAGLEPYMRESIVVLE